MRSNKRIKRLKVNLVINKSYKKRWLWNIKRIGSVFWLDNWAMLKLVKSSALRLGCLFKKRRPVKKEFCDRITVSGELAKRKKYRWMRRQIQKLYSGSGFNSVRFRPKSFAKLGDLGLNGRRVMMNKWMRLQGFAKWRGKLVLRQINTGEFYKEKLRLKKGRRKRRLQWIKWKRLRAREHRRRVKNRRRMRLRRSQRLSVKKKFNKIRKLTKKVKSRKRGLLVKGRKRQFARLRQGANWLARFIRRKFWVYRRRIGQFGKRFCGKRKLRGAHKQRVVRRLRKRILKAIRRIFKKYRKLKMLRLVRLLKVVFVMVKGNVKVKRRKRRILVSLTGIWDFVIKSLAFIAIKFYRPSGYRVYSIKKNRGLRLVASKKRRRRQGVRGRLLRGKAKVFKKKGWGILGRMKKIRFQKVKGCFEKNKRQQLSLVTGGMFRDGWIKDGLMLNLKYVRQKELIAVGGLNCREKTLYSNITMYQRLKNCLRVLSHLTKRRKERHIVSDLRRMDEKRINFRRQIRNKFIYKLVVTGRKRKVFYELSRLGMCGRVRRVNKHVFTTSEGMLKLKRNRSWVSLWGKRLKRKRFFRRYLRRMRVFIRKRIGRRRKRFAKRTLGVKNLITGNEFLGRRRSKLKNVAVSSRGVRRRKFWYEHRMVKRQLWVLAWLLLVGIQPYNRKRGQQQLKKGRLWWKNLVGGQPRAGRSRILTKYCRQVLVVLRGPWFKRLRWVGKALVKGLLRLVRRIKTRIIFYYRQRFKLFRMRVGWWRRFCRRFRGRMWFRYSKSWRRRHSFTGLGRSERKGILKRFKPQNLVFNKIKIINKC